MKMTMIELPGKRLHTGGAGKNESLFEVINERIIFTVRDGSGSFSDPADMKRCWEAEIQGMDGSWGMYDQVMFLSKFRVGSID